MRDHSCSDEHDGRKPHRARHRSNRSALLPLGADGLIDEARPTAHIDHLRSVGIIAVDWLALIPRNFIEVSHRRFQTLRAGQLASPG